MKFCVLFCKTHHMHPHKHFPEAYFSNNKLSVKWLIGTLFCLPLCRRDTQRRLHTNKQSNSKFLPRHHTPSFLNTTTYKHSARAQANIFSLSHLQLPVYNAISAHYVSFVFRTNCQQRWGQSSYCSGRCLSNPTAGLSKWTLTEHWRSWHLRCKAKKISKVSWARTTTQPHIMLSWYFQSNKSW